MRVLLLAGVRDALRAEKLILALEQTLRKREIPVTVADLGAGKLWTVALGDEPARHPAIALFDDRVVFASRGDDLRRLIAESGKPLAGDTLYQTLRARLGGSASLVAWSKTSGTFKDLLLSLAAGAPATGAGALPSAELSEFGARVDRHLASMPPSLAVGRSSAGLLEYEALTPFNMGIAASLMLALAAPQVEQAAAAREVERSLVMLRSIAFACEAYAVEHGSPPVAASVDDAKALLEPTWATGLPAADAWGYGIDFRSDGASYVIAHACQQSTES